MIEAHSMDPAVVLDMLAGLGGHGRPHPHRRLRAGDGRRGNRAVGPVAGAVDRAVDAIDELLAELCAPAPERT